MINKNTTLVMFAVVAALGLAVGTLALPIIQEANALVIPRPAAPPCSGGEDCRTFGEGHSQRGEHGRP